jgi:hypothetical protein
VIVALLLLASPLRAEEDDAHRKPTWYAGWSLIVGGGAIALTGTALSTREPQEQSTSGWVLLGAGTAIWIGGAVLLKFTHRHDEKLVVRR